MPMLRIFALAAILLALANCNSVPQSGFTQSDPTNFALKDHGGDGGNGGAGGGGAGGGGAGGSGGAGGKM